MSYSIRDEESQKNKERLENLIKEAGYNSIRQFCLDAGVDQSNLYTNLDGTWNMSTKRMFKIAKLLKVPIDQMLDIFYHEEFVENQKLFKVPVAGDNQ